MTDGDPERRRRMSIMEPTRKGKAKMEFNACGQVIYNVLSQRNVSTLLA